MTYLELCQRLAEESGTISGVRPTVVTGQTGRLKHIVSWVDAAWLKLQTEYETWLWRRSEFTSSALTTGIAKYTGASWGLTDWSQWIQEWHNVTIYDTAVGLEDEAELDPITWATWRQRYGRGLQTNNRPVSYAISPQGEFCLGPLPDKDTYIVQGEYRTKPQVLVADDDVPVMPVDYHLAIVWSGLMLLAEYDEAPEQLAGAKIKYDAIMADLRLHQLPRMSIQTGFEV